MASSALQLLGFLISLIGVAATVAATVMVEWTKNFRGEHRTYEGLWMECESDDIELWICETHQTLIKLPIEIQATRAVMLVSLFLSAVAVMVSVVGMKCTHFLDDVPDSKSKTALTGGILFMISGLLTIIITSWYVKMIVTESGELDDKLRKEFGHAVFVNWAGGLLTVIGGIFLSCMRCCGTKSSVSRSPSQLLPTTKPKSNYV
ncbi:claudin-7-like [Melanotaenia boesemani]|uniref:claudin-7-like n=1 Tax=Melanotaenia boesemani TaxID=1250792 RepID=UPI001C05A780|nr:claudin-7-like [Melanotaenia boesemani]